MKKTLLLTLISVIALVGISSCKSKKVDEKPVASTGRLAPYSEDAHRLALRDELTSRSQPKEGFEIDADRVNFYFEALTKIGQMIGSTEEIPSHLSEIHTFPNPSVREVLLVLDKDSQFKDAFSQKRTITPDLYMNQLLSQNRISIKDYQESSIGPQVLLYADKMLNAPELAHTLAQFKGISGAEAVIPSGDGNDITAGAEGKNATAIKLSIGKGDCPSGCIHRKFWVFYVHPDGSVTFEGTRGELPE